MRFPSQSLTLKYDSRPVVLALFLLATLPTLLWVLLDRGLWVSDTSYYGLWALRLHEIQGYGIPALVWEMLAMNDKPPFLPWAGQLFVPLGEALGHVESGLLLLNWLAQGATLVLIYAAIRHVYKSGYLAILACLLVAAAPVFTTTGKQFYAQPVQGLVISWFLYILAFSRERDVTWVILNLCAASALGMLVVMSTPSLCVLPGLAVLGILVKRATGQYRLSGKFIVRPSPGRQHILPGLFALLFVPGAIAWYASNLDTALEYARWAFSYEYAGFATGWVSKFGIWLIILGTGLSIPLSLLFVLLVIRRMPVIFSRNARAASFSGVFALVSAAQVLLALFVFSMSAQHTARYVLPMLPYIAVVLVWAVQSIRHERARLVVTGIIVIQLVLSQVSDFGSVNLGSQFVRPLELSTGTSKEVEIVEKLAELALQNEGELIALATGAVGVYSLQMDFFLAKFPQRSTGSLPRFLSVEFLMTNADVSADPSLAWATILEEKPKLLVSVTEEAFQKGFGGITGGWKKVIEGTWEIMGRIRESDLYERVPLPGFNEIELYRKKNTQASKHGAAERTPARITASKSADYIG